MEETKNTSLALFNENDTNTYCSANVEDIESKKAMYNAITNADVLLNDCVGETIVIKDVYVSKRQVIDEETGEVQDKYQTVLIDTDGKSYATGSYGVYNSLRNIFKVFGLPNTWEEPLAFDIRKVKIKNGHEVLKLLLHT